MGRQARPPMLGRRAHVLARPLSVPDSETARQLRRLDQSIESVGGVSIVSGRLIVRAESTAYGTSGVPLPTGTVTRLEHGLGRRLAGWFLADLTPDGNSSPAAGHVERVLKDGTDVADDLRDIWLYPVGFGGKTVTVRVWVF